MKLLPSWGLGPVEELRRTVLLLLFVFGITAAGLFLGKSAEGTSRLTMVATLAASVVVVPFVRSRIKGILCSGGQWGVPTVVYGAGPVGQKVVQMLKSEQGLGYNPLAVLDDNPQNWGRTVEGIRVLGHTDYVTPHAPVAILALPNIGQQRQLELLEGPLSHYRKVLVIPDLLEAPSLWIRPRDLNGILGLEITSNLTHPMAQIIKRLADILFVYITLPLWLPISAILFAAIWIEDRSNPFFLQTRIGQDGKTFRTWKFRTMVPDAEEVLRKSLFEDEAMRLEWETKYKLRDDPRITKVGKFLRRSSLDELPQIINVLRGEMSLVGPRPLPQYHHLELPARVRDLRQRVLPGLTGLWQVSGRSDIGTEGMEQHDPYYVRNWSMWLDLVVLARTLRTVVSRSGAY
jgi:Undecaprenyl-phosphate galactose phosphotransferase WbaP